MLGFLSPLCLLFILCMLAAAAGAQTLSSPLFLGSGQDCLPHDPRLARHPDGGFVAAWVDGQEVHLRRFDRHGAALGQEWTLFGVSVPALAVAPNGHAAVTVRSGTGWQLHVLTRELFLIDTAELEGVRPNGHALVAAEGEDGFVAVLQRQDALAFARFDSLGQPRGAVVEIPSSEEGSLMDLLVQPDGDLWLATVVGQLVTSPPSGRLNVLRVAADTGELEQRNEGLPLLRTASLAAAGDEVALVLGTGARIMLIRLDDTLEHVVEPTLVAERQSQGAEISALELTSDPAGNLLVVWSEGPGFLDEPPVIFLQALSPEGEPEGPVTEAATSTLQDLVPLTLAATPLAAGEATIAWAGSTLNPAVILPIPCEDVPGPHAVRAPFGGAESLLLGDGRFRVEVGWSAPFQGTFGRGQALPDSDDTGSFWFFDPANVELTVKLLDGRAVNGHFWFFYGGLSDVSYRIVVTDQLTGFSKSYDNPPGRLGSFADTFAFSGID